MISINNSCDGESYRGDRRMTTITQPERFGAGDHYRFQPHDQVRATVFPYEQFLPITVANKDELPEGYEPLKKYIE